MQNFKQHLAQAFWILLAVGVGIGGAVAATGEHGIELSTAGLIGLAYTALRIGLQWYAANRPRTNVARRYLALLLLPALTLNACATTATTRYTESIWEEAGDGQLYENKFEGEARSKAGIFGQVPDAVHDITAQWGGDSGQPSRLSMGQSARLDNAAQVQALEVLSAFLGEIFARAITAYAEAQAPPPTPTASETALDLLRDLGAAPSNQSLSP